MFYRHDIAEILLKVALNTINLNLRISYAYKLTHINDIDADHKTSNNSYREHS
jgi:hypothetical protein